MIRRSLNALVLVLGLAAAASAGDDAPPAPAVPPATKPAPAKGGFTCKVKLNNGRTVSGVVRVDGIWERRHDQQGWVACAKDDPGACVRLTYVGGRDGSMVLAAKDVASAENLGALGSADLDKLAQSAAAGEKAAQTERDRLRKERQEKRAAEAAAAAAKEAADQAAAIAAEAAAIAKADGELLAKFPPKEWSAERREAIEKRRLLMHINPNDQEQEFLDRFEDWARAATAAKAAEIKDSKDTEKAKDSKDGKPAGAPTK